MCTRNGIDPGRATCMGSKLVRADDSAPRCAAAAAGGAAAAAARRVRQPDRPRPAGRSKPAAAS